MCFKPTSLTPNPPPPQEILRPKTFSYFHYFHAHYAPGNAHCPDSWPFGLGPLTAITWYPGTFLFSYPRYDCCHIYFTYSLLLFHFFPCLIFSTFLFYFLFLPFQLATNKRRSQWKAWLGVIMSANLLGHLEKYEKSTAAATPYGHSLFSFCHLARNFNIEPRKKNERTRKGKNKIVAYYGI